MVDNQLGSQLVIPSWLWQSSSLSNPLQSHQPISIEWFDSTLLLTRTSARLCKWLKWLEMALQGRRTARHGITATYFAPIPMCKGLIGIILKDDRKIAEPDGSNNSCKYANITTKSLSNRYLDRGIKTSTNSSRFFKILQDPQKRSIVWICSLHARTWHVTSKCHRRIQAQQAFLAGPNGSQWVPRDATWIMPGSFTSWASCAKRAEPCCSVVPSNALRRSCGQIFQRRSLESISWMSCGSTDSHTFCGWNFWLWQRYPSLQDECH